MTIQNGVGFKTLLAEANADVDTITIEALQQTIGDDTIVVIDLRAAADGLHYVAHRLFVVEERVALAPPHHRIVRRILLVDERPRLSWHRERGQTDSLTFSFYFLFLRSRFPP